MRAHEAKLDEAFACDAKDYRFESCHGLHIMSNIAIYGGSFDPPHNGHAHILKSLSYDRFFHRVMVIPASNNPLKTNKSFVSFSDKINMLRIMTKDLSRIEFNLEEAINPDLIYFWNMYTEVISKTAKPDDKLVLVLGEDCYHEFDKWYNHDKIREKFSLMVFTRSHNPKITGDVIQIHNNINNVDISSTIIRDALAGNNNTDITRILPHDILQYIIQRKLYQ